MRYVWPSTEATAALAGVTEDEDMEGEEEDVVNEDEEMGGHDPDRAI